MSYHVTNFQINKIMHLIKAFIKNFFLERVMSLTLLSIFLFLGNILEIGTMTLKSLMPENLSFFEMYVLPIATC